MSELTKKKRQYSRNGCKECKRRKLKCDEGKPKCWNCARLNKSCNYERTIKFTNARTFTIETQNTKLVNLPDSASDVDHTNKLKNAKEQPVAAKSEPAVSSLTFLQPPSMVQNPPLAAELLELPKIVTPEPDLQAKSNAAFELEMRRQLSFDPPTPLHQSKELDNNLFTGASHLISDLNDLIQSFDTDFDYFPDHSRANSNSVRAVSETSSEPANSPSYDFYIRRLTNTLETKYNNESSPKSVSSTSQNLSAFPPPPMSTMIANLSERPDFVTGLNASIKSQDLNDLATFFHWDINSPHFGYLNVLITKIHLNVLPLTTNLLHNSFIKCFLLEAKSSPHLLYALLAISARYESYQARPKIGTPPSEHDDPHKRLRAGYLSSCLKSLDSILHSKPKILNNIQSLLLTILILASDYSASTGSQWRAHLRGAKDLLIKYCKYMAISLDLGIVWIWFYSMETLAALTSSSGGTIHNFPELIEFLDVVKSTSPVGVTLQRFGFYTAGNYHVPAPVHSTFNLYLGFNDDVQELFKEIVLTLEARRVFVKKKAVEFAVQHILNEDGQVKNSQVLKMIGLVEKARLFKCLADGPPYRISIDSPNHPLNPTGIHANNPDGRGIVMSGYIHNTNPQTTNSDDTQNWYSWFDLSQQLYTDASYLKILTMKHCFGSKGLAITNELVQDVVNRMLLGLEPLVSYKQSLTEQDIEELALHYSKLSESSDSSKNVDFDHYLYYQFDHRLIMVQWPLFVCGLCSVLPKQKLLIESCFKALMDLGIGSGEISLMKLKKLWSLQTEGFDYENYDIFSDENDSVPFV
ncbi:hypothetical protein OGAPHI_003825 [Ogataea philodendri]|uniref:Zn(2)-C6 fungal-type domain-containing protein n=2 Tax=Saccharomycotina TaxID=147537 RepID=A0A9P8P655_9ASCO|nr:uncharacterized protein OGAPHI_003825 [Ogataea philodendri]KAH3665637.1 hypothetical protein OGAPHI_003825 [Ogataea philodendri]